NSYRSRTGLPEIVSAAKNASRPLCGFSTQRHCGPREAAGRAQNSILEVMQKPARIRKLWMTSEKLLARLWGHRYWSGGGAGARAGGPPTQPAEIPGPANPVCSRIDCQRILAVECAAKTAPLRSVTLPRTAGRRRPQEAHQSSFIGSR